MSRSRLMLKIHYHCVYNIFAGGWSINVVVFVFLYYFSLVISFAGKRKLIILTANIRFNRDEHQNQLHLLAYCRFGIYAGCEMFIVRRSTASARAKHFNKIIFCCCRRLGACTPLLLFCHSTCHWQQQSFSLSLHFGTGIILLLLIIPLYAGRALLAIKMNVLFNLNNGTHYIQFEKKKYKIADNGKWCVGSGWQTHRVRPEIINNKINVLHPERARSMPTNNRKLGECASRLTTNTSSQRMHWLSL